MQGVLGSPSGHGLGLFTRILRIGPYGESPFLVAKLSEISDPDVRRARAESAQQLAHLWAPHNRLEHPAPRCGQVQHPEACLPAYSQCSHLKTRTR